MSAIDRNHLKMPEPFRFELEDRRFLGSVDAILNAGDTSFSHKTVRRLLELMDQQAKQLVRYEIMIGIQLGVPLIFIGKSGQIYRYVLDGAFSVDGGVELEAGEVMGTTPSSLASETPAPEDGHLWAEEAFFEHLRMQKRQQT